MDLEEPDWRERFSDYVLNHPAPVVPQLHSALRRRLAEDAAFEKTLRDWRRFHAMADGKTKRRPAPAVDGVIALAALRIFPPRSLDRDISRGGPLFVEQHDAHCQLIIRQEAWKIRAIEDRLLHLSRGWEPDVESMTIDLSRAKWGLYCDKAVEFLRAGWPDFEKGGNESCQEERISSAS